MDIFLVNLFNGIPCWYACITNHSRIIYDLIKYLQSDKIYDPIKSYDLIKSYGIVSLSKSCRPSGLWSNIRLTSY